MQLSAHHLHPWDLGVGGGALVAGQLGSVLQPFYQVRNALHVVMGHEVVLAGCQVGLGLLQAGDASEREHGSHATAVAEENVGLQAVTHHECAGRVHAEVLRDALKHVRAGLAHHQGLASRGYLHGGSQAPSTCRETEMRQCGGWQGGHPGPGTGALRRLGTGVQSGTEVSQKACFPVLA